MSEPCENPNFQGTKTEVISVLKNARSTGLGAKSWPRAFLPPGWSKISFKWSFDRSQAAKTTFQASEKHKELKMSENGFRLEASDWEKTCLRTAPASCRILACHGQGGTARSRSCFGHFRAAQRVLGALLGRFVGTSGRQSAFRGLFFWYFRAAQRILEAAFLALQGGTARSGSAFLTVCLQKGLLNLTKLQNFKAPKRRWFQYSKMLVLQG